MYVGGLAGYIYSDDSRSYLKNCSNSSHIEAEAYVGCIAGKLDNVKIESCSNENSDLIATKYRIDSGVKYAYVGGYVGYGYLVTDCANSVAISYTAEGRFVGGIAGYIDHPSSCEMQNLINTADISGADYVGGIFGGINSNSSNYGNTYTVTFTEFENSGNVTGTGEYVGGLIGYGYFKKGSGGLVIYIFDSKNSGDVQGQMYVGGLVGYAYSDSTQSSIMDSTSTGRVTGESAFDDIAGKLENITIK